jgi:hypothetical protein
MEIRFFFVSWENGPVAAGGEVRLAPFDAGCAGLLGSRVSLVGVH